MRAIGGFYLHACVASHHGVEALIGEWLKRRREKGAVAPVQVHTRYVPDLDRLPTRARADVVRGIDRSLARLGVDQLDLVQLHWWDYDIPGYLDQARQACVLALDDTDCAALARVQLASSGPGGDVYDLERVKGGPHASIMRYTLAR